MSGEPPALTVDDVSFAYTRERPALDGVSFTAAFGRVTALLGPNGAGKTTLMALITRLFRPQSGRIAVAGEPLDKEPLKALARMGVVFQQASLDLDLSVRQNLAYAASLQGMGSRERAGAIDAALERARLHDRAKEPVRTLSGGQKRRVEIARALLHAPSLLVLDEPTVGLDIDSRRQLVDAVHELASQGLAVLLTTHLIDEVWDDDALVVLDRGQIKAAGSSASVRQGEDLATAYRRLTA